MPAVISTPVDCANLPIATLRTIRTSDVSSYAVLASDALVSINVDHLQPGDVVLFKGDTKDISDRVIVAYQATVCGPKFNDWTHVGVLDGRLNVWDAMPDKHVRTRPLREVLRERNDLTVVRPSVNIAANELDRALLRLSEHKYKIFDYETGPLLFYRLSNSLIGGGVVRTKYTAAQKNVICSSFVTQVLRYATKVDFFRSLPVVVPADFLIDAMFTQVPDLHWCKLEAI